MDDLRNMMDVETGEVFLIRKPKKKVNGGWCRMYQLKLEELAKDEELRGMPKDVLLYMVSKVGYDNICRVAQVVIARELKTTPQYISKIIKTLKKGEYIIEVKEEGSLKCYRFNEKFVIKGTLEE